MAGLNTIRRGVGFGPLATITRGYLGGFEFGPGVALIVLASPSVALVVAAANIMAVQAANNTAAVAASPSTGTLTATPSTVTVVPLPSALE